MKTYYYIIIYLTLLISCKSSIENKSIEKVNKIENIVREDLSSLISNLPIGKKELLEIKVKDIESIKLFEYYDTINGISSPNFKVIKSIKYKSFYKPTKSNTINDEDSFFLKTNDKYEFFDLVKILPKKNQNSIYVFEGVSSTYDYDGNTIFINRKDLVVVNNESEIIDEINIYFNYSDGIIARTKLFFIDENYTLYLRYYNENEENKINFTDITKYLITSEGIIKKINHNSLKIGSTVYAQVETYLNVRSEPNSSEVLGSWLKVSLNGKEGYVSIDFVKEAP